MEDLWYTLYEYAFVLQGGAPFVYENLERALIPAEAIFSLAATENVTSLIASSQA